MVLAKKYVVTQIWSGEVKESDVALVEENLPPLKDGEALFETIYVAVDFLPRILSNDMSIGDTVLGSHSVARVVASKNSPYPIGELVLAMFGWRTHTVVAGRGEEFEINVIDKNIITDVPLSVVLGTLGATGQTAYLGLNMFADAKPGEVFFVNTAAGAVGHVVGQLAKLKGLETIGCAGTEEKCQWLRQLGFDHVFNYKTKDLSESLRQAAPNGVDIFWDHVGGDFSSTVVLNHMAKHGRVLAIGSTATYNADTSHKGYTPWYVAMMKALTIKGFNLYEDVTEDQKIDASKALKLLITEGKLQTKETLIEGFDNTVKAFLGTFTGTSIGKTVIKV